MKVAKVLVALSVFLTVTISASSAQAATPSIRDDLQGREVKNNVIAFSPLPALLGQVIVDYERRLTRHVSLLATPYASFLQISLPGSIDGSRLATKGGGAELGVNFYTGGNALRGFFLSPFVGYQYSHADVLLRGYAGSGHAEVHAVKLGGRLGRQWFPTSRMVINLSGGLSYLHHLDSSRARTSNEFGTEDTALSVAGITPNLKFTLGVAF